MMNYFSEKFSYFTDYLVKRVKPIEENKQRNVSKYEIYFGRIYKILSWEDVSHTLRSFLAVNLLFWLTIYSKLKFFGFLFITILAIFICDSYIATEAPADSELKYIRAFNKIRLNIPNLFINLKIIRRENPLLFCVGMCTIYLFLNFVGRNTSEYGLIYCMILGIFFIPLGFILVPDKYMKRIRCTLGSFIDHGAILTEEELSLFDKDLEHRDADLESLLTDRTADSVSNSLISGMSAMPSHMDFVEIHPEINEEDLIPDRRLYRKSSHTPDNLSSDSDSDQLDIHFDSSHFSGNTSSEEENYLGKGLQFGSDSLNNTSGNLISNSGGLSGVLSNFATLGGALVGNTLKTAVTPATVQRKDSSSESEFEFVDHDDLK